MTLMRQKISGKFSMSRVASPTLSSNNQVFNSIFNHTRMFFSVPGDSSHCMRVYPGQLCATQEFLVVVIVVVVAYSSGLAVMAA